MPHHVRGIAPAILLGMILSAGELARADFTYQGQLKEAGAPASGSRGLTFNLYSAATGGAPLATANLAVDVVDGVFTVALPWDAHFRGEDRFVEVVVQGTPLLPRTLVTPAPWSEFSRNTRGLTVDAFGRIGIGTATPAARLDVRGSGSVNVFAGDGAPFGVAGFLTNWTTPQTHAWFAEQGVQVAAITAGGLGRFKGGLELGDTTTTERYLTIQTGQNLSGVRLRNLAPNSGQPGSIQGRDQV